MFYCVRGGENSTYVVAGDGAFGARKGVGGVGYHGKQKYILPYLSNYKNSIVISF